MLERDLYNQALSWMGLHDGRADALTAGKYTQHDRNVVLHCTRQMFHEASTPSPRGTLLGLGRSVCGAEAAE